MNLFKKQTEEVTNEIKEQVNTLVEDGKVLSIGILAIGCLTVGYILGCVTTGAMCRTLTEVHK